MGPPQCVQGVSGKALSFNGSTDIISIPADPGLDNMDFTISMWFNQAGPGKDGGGTFIDRLLKGSNNQDTRWDSLGLFTFDGSQPYLFYNWDGDENNCCDGKYFPFSPSILNNTWYFLGVTKSGTSIKLFLNGSLTNSVILPSDNNPYFYPGDWLIGSQIDLGQIWQPFNGMLDEVRIYNRALTETEIKALAENVLVDSGAEWRYSETEQAGWTEISFDDSQWNIGITPFDDHSVTGWCAFGGNGTNWPLNTSLYLRKDIDVKQQGDLTLRIAIDNDFVLYFDGNEVAAINSEWCPYKWQYEYNIQSVNAGTHTVAVKITDRGDDNGFDLMVSQSEAPPPPPTCIYTYSDWEACQTDNTQSRTVLTTTPEGCVGTPELSRSCDYVPPSDGSSILITKYAQRSQINSGAQAIFDITIENNGETPLVNIEIKDDQCDELKADKKNNTNYLAIGAKLKYTCIKNNVTRDLTNVAAARAVSINGIVVTSSATATVKVDKLFECDPSLYENICDKKGQVVTGFYILSKRYSKKYNCNYGGSPNIVVIDRQVMPNGDIKCIEQGIVGESNDCLGRCGPGCGSFDFDERYTQECFNHDLCTRSTGNILGPCTTAFDIAQEGWTCAEECPK